MTTVEYSENIVAEKVAEGNTVTVPSGEVWRVYIPYEFNRVKINGDVILGGGGGSNSQPNLGPLQTVLVGGDTVSPEFGNDIFINGFEISSSIDNSAVSVSLSDSENVAVPSGEDWVVTVATQGICEIESYAVNTHTSSDGSIPTKAVIPGGETVSSRNGATHLGGIVI